MRNPVAQLVKLLLGPGRLGLPLVGARPGDDRDVCLHDHRVLDEDRVWAVRERRDLDGLPTLSVQSGYVAVPLPERQVDVDRDTLDMSEQPFSQSGRKPRSSSIEKLLRSDLLGSPLLAEAFQYRATFP